MKILLIEDDKITGQALVQILENNGMICDIAETGSAGITACKLHEYDLILLDVVLPDYDGFKIIKTLRDLDQNTPIIVLSGLRNVEDKIKCLDLGSDDFVCKPVLKAELLSRIHAVARRSMRNPNPVIKIGELQVDLIKKCIKTSSNKIIDFTEKEYMMLTLLARRMGSVISKESFIKNLYHGTDEPEFKIIDVFICKIRNKIKEALNTHDEYIHTSWGRGYIMEYRQKSVIDDVKRYGSKKLIAAA
jgi:two-component system cell cycle response regulator CtrA